MITNIISWKVLVDWWSFPYICICILPSSLQENHLVKRFLTNVEESFGSNSWEIHFALLWMNPFVFLCWVLDCKCVLWYFEFIRIMSRKLPSSREEGEVSLICSTKTQDLILLVFKYFQLKFCMEKKSWDTAFKDLMMKIVWTCFENDE